MHNPASIVENDTHKLRWDFEIHVDHLILARWPELIIINKKREFAKLSTLLSRLIIKENWKNVKRRISTLTLLENWKKLWNMTVTILPVMIGAFGSITKGLLKGLEDLEVGGRVETIQTTALLKTVREESWRFEKFCCHSNSSEKPSADADMKKSKEVIILMIS